MVAAVAGIEIRARKTELGSSCCGYSAGSTPLVANGAVAAGPDLFGPLASALAALNPERDA